MDRVPALPHTVTQPWLTGRKDKLTPPAVLWTRLGALVCLPVFLLSHRPPGQAQPTASLCTGTGDTSMTALTDGARLRDMSISRKDSGSRGGVFN